MLERDPELLELEVCPRTKGVWIHYTLPLVMTKGVKWLLKSQHEITRAELSAEITSHTQRKKKD